MLSFHIDSGYVVTWLGVFEEFRTRILGGWKQSMQSFWWSGGSTLELKLKWRGWSKDIFGFEIFDSGIFWVGEYFNFLGVPLFK